MAWSTPRTWVTGETVTAALMNAHIRDQFRETSPFTVSAGGDLPYADAANSMNSKLAIGASGRTLVSDGSAPVWRENGFSQESTFYKTDGLSGSSGYQDLDTIYWDSGSGSNTVDVTVTTDVSAIVTIGVLFASVDATTTLASIAYRVSGATTIAAGGTRGALGKSAIADNQFCLSKTYRESALTAGSNVFTFVAIPDHTSGDIITLQNPYVLVQST